MGGQKQNKHICRFNRTNKTLDALFPKNLRFSRVRRKFREFMLISEENGRRQRTSKGTSGYLFEKEKHLTQHYHMIHPYSKFRQYWEIVVILEVALSLIIRTFLISQLRNTVLRNMGYQIYGLTSDLFEMADATVLTFLTGYRDAETRTITLETRKVLLHNIKKVRFYLNVVTSLPLDFIIYVLSIDLDENPGLKFCVALKILKIILVHQYLIHISKIYNWSELIFRIVWLLVTMLLLSHTLTCMLNVIVFGSEFGVPDNAFNPKHDCFYRHFAMFHLVSTLFFLENGYSDRIIVKSMKDHLFFILLLIIVNLLNVLFIGTFIQLLGLKNSAFVQYEEMSQEVQKFLIQENLPKYIHKKVFKYFEFRFRYRYFREKIILDTLSPPLRQEIANYLCMDLLINSDSIFNDVPYELACVLCQKLKFEIFLAGDTIVRAGKEAEKMFFVYSGTIVLYSQRGKEIAHVFEGQQFGIATFIPSDHQYMVTAVALETSECYVLRYRDFMTCVTEYPEYKEIVSRSAIKKRPTLFRDPRGHK